MDQTEKKHTTTSSTVTQMNQGFNVCRRLFDVQRLGTRIKDPQSQHGKKKNSTSTNSSHIDLQPQGNPPANSS